MEHDKEKVKAIVILGVLLFLVTIDLVTNIAHRINYDDQKASGNIRWEQVEERIIEIEQKVVEVEKKVENLE